MQLPHQVTLFLDPLNNKSHFIEFGIFACSSLFPFSSKPDIIVLPFQSLYFSVYSTCHHVFIVHHQPCPSFLNCSFLPLPPTLFVTISISFLSTISSSLSSSIAPSKSLDIPHITTSLSSSSKDRRSSHSSFTASFGFVIFNTVKQTSFKSLQIYFTLFSTKLRGVHN